MKRKGVVQELLLLDIYFLLDGRTIGCPLGEMKIKSVPTGIRTPVAGVKGQCPRPLDDGDLFWAVQDLNLRLSA